MIFLLIIAIKQEKKNMIKYLIEKGADISKNNGAPIKAAINKSLTLFKLVTEENPNFDPSNAQYIETAIERKQYDILDYLIESGANINSSLLRRAPIYFALDRKNMDLLQRLLDHGADPNIIFDNDGRIQAQSRRLYTPIIYCIKHEFIDAIEPLVKAGADINGRVGERKRTPLCIATKQRKNEFIKKLLELGADITIKSSRRNFTPIHQLFNCRGSRFNDDIESILKIFLQHGADINELDSMGKTPLCYVTSPSLAKLLTDNGADVNFRNAEGKTPLHYIARMSMDPERVIDIMKVLIDHGADPEIKDNGSKPIAYSRSPEMREYLESVTSSEL
jgi:ankyrin repeat protein